MEYAEIEISGKKLDKQLNTIRSWRETKKNLISRAAELKAQANKVKDTNPYMASKLNQRSKALSAEAERMAAEDKRGIPYAQVKRSDVLGRLALVRDSVKK